MEKIFKPEKACTSMRDAIQNVLGESIRLRDVSLYIEACTHKSAEGERGCCQERLEHLGDTVLSTVITHMLFDKHPYTDEGILSRLRTKLVNGKALAGIGRAMRLDRILIVGATGAGAVYHDKVYEDTFEALVGAVYVDLGLHAAKAFVKDSLLRYMPPEMLYIEDNYKVVLHRYTLRMRVSEPSYESKTSDNQTETVCTVYTSSGSVQGTSAAPTKRQSEMQSAKHVLQQLGYDVTSASIF